MTNHERYRLAFSQVHAPAGCARRALERLEEEGTRARPRHRRRVLRTALILAAVAALLTATVSAQLADGAVSNLLAPLYGCAQTELVDSIGHPVGASVSVNGYTLTADAVIGDRYNVAVVYTLTREDGQPIPQQVRFDGHENSLWWHTSGGGSLSYYPADSGRADQLRIVEQWTSAGPLRLLRRAQVCFTDLQVWQAGEDAPTVLAQGTWELEFTARYRDTTVEIPAEDLTVTGSEGVEYQVNRIQLSPLGVHMDLGIPCDPAAESPEYRGQDFDVALLKQDGTRIRLTDRNFGSSWTEGTDLVEASFSSFFDQPIPLEEIAALEICGEPVPVG